MDKLKILVVDDEKRMRILVKDFLVKADFDVLEASNGGEALDIFYENKDIALILLDVMMPRMDGYEFVKDIFCIDLKKEDKLKISLQVDNNEYPNDLWG